MSEPTGKYSITMPRDIAEAARARSGPSGLSGYGARADDLRVITSAATVVEVPHPRLSRPALEWTLSRVVVEPVTEPIARRATAILAEAGLHGHRHAIDAMLSATALAVAGPVTVLTS